MGHRSFREGRAGRGGGWKAAGSLLEGILAGREHLVRAKEAMVSLIWEDVVGPAIAEATQTLFCHHRRVYVTTKSGPWAHELMNQRQAIIEKLNERLGGPYIEEIHFEPKELTRRQRARGKGRGRAEFAGPTKWVGEGPRPTDISAELEAIHLTREEEEAIWGAVASIHDPQIRERITQALSKEYRLRRWKQDHGWRECPACSGLFLGQGEVCDYCRILGPSL